LIFNLELNPAFRCIFFVICILSSKKKLPVQTKKDAAAIGAMDFAVQSTLVKMLNGFCSKQPWETKQS